VLYVLAPFTRFKSLLRTLRRVRHLPLLTLAALWRILKDTAVSSAVVVLIVGFAGLYAWAGSTMGVIDRMTKGLLGLSKSPVVNLWAINLLVFLAGSILDGISIY